MVGLAERMAKELEKKGYGEGQLLLRIDPRGTHNEKHWRRRARAALRFMFRK
jgi:hypothetical protein